MYTLNFINRNGRIVTVKYDSFVNAVNAWRYVVGRCSQCELIRYDGTPIL